MQKELKKKKESFLKFNYKKFSLFLAILIFIPVPYSDGLTEGITPIITALPTILLMGLWALISLELIASLFFIGEAALLLSFGYLLTCLIYKFLYKINNKNKEVTWAHIIITIIFLVIIYSLANLFEIISVTA